MTGLRSAAVLRSNIYQVKEGIAERGHATRAEQQKLLVACVDDVCIRALLVWLIQGVGVPVRDIMLEIKTVKGKVRPEAVRLERERVHLVTACALLPEQRVSA